MYNESVTTEHTTPIQRAVHFNERLIGCNDLDKLGFEEWVFHPAMLFRARNKWWGNQGRRSSPHEGLDLCLFRTKDGEVRRLGEDTKIPVMFDGVIVKVGDDFLGKSIYVRHSIGNGEGSQLHTVYGHTRPCEGMHPGQVLTEGDVLGPIATGKARSRIPSHLHISVAWIPESLDSEGLDWEVIGNPGLVALMDPLRVIGCQYSILENSKPFWETNHGQHAQLFRRH